jgi:hypothetical protein
VQRERRRIGAAVVMRNFGERLRIAFPVRSQQFFRLALELMEIRMFAKRTERRVYTRHDELLPPAP